MKEFIGDLFIGIKGKNDGKRKYRLTSTNYWRWHIKWNIFMLILFSILAGGYIAENELDVLGILGTIVVFLCIFAIVAKVIYDTDRWDVCIKCGTQYINESKHCSNCGIIREGNTIDGISWRLRKKSLRGI